MKALWNRIEAWLAAHVPGGAGNLNPGATDTEIAATERFLGVAFPDDVRESFRIHDGQADGPWLLWGDDLLSLQRVRDEWTVWKSLLDAGKFRDFRGDTGGHVVPDWWHPRWIPLTSDGGGNSYCLDLHPGPNGVSGQVIRMWHDDSPRPLVAPNFRDCLATFADALDAGQYVYSPDYLGLVPKGDVG